MIADWASVALGEITDWTSGGTPSKGNQAYWGGDIPWISASSMKTALLCDSTLKITEEGLGNGSRLAPVDSVLLLVRGSELHKRIPVGIATCPVAFNQDVKALRVRPSVLPQYLFYWLMGNEPMLLSKVEHTGIGAGKLDTDVLKSLAVDLPPIHEQSTIVDILGSLDDKIELNRRTNETLEAMAKAVFKSWFVDFDPVHAKSKGRQPDGMDAETAKLFPSSFEDSEIGRVPKGWKVGTLRDCCERVENGGTPSRGVQDYWEPKEVSWLTSGEVRQKIVTLTENFISRNGLENSSAKLWDKKTTVVALYGATAGQVCFLGAKMCANQACCGLIPRPTWHHYVYLHTSSSIATLEQQVRGSAQQNLSQQIVADLPTLLPSPETIAEFDAFVATQMDRCIDSLFESRSLAAIRDTLLPKLLSGDVRIQVKGVQ